ncbi:tRNA(His) guanylyltransferase 1-like isoform X1 [Solanum verrucosum]|uniref:tRNA(His) guanylyltransferase 1-like isoform X1 n=1 Tax=Solanum verrucosum TaxID=315347 RepID=UPI0020D17C38|nr:tRNA(His) guanylyltransferase 1-like isoform X1 [Solanum verrucosum]
MANSRYEYVKWFEVEDEVMYPNIIVVQIDGRDFGCFSEKHGFEKPNDDKALNLMNACAIKVLENFSDVIFAYGFNDEYSFVLKKETTFYQRRASKILSIIVSFFSSTYVTKWKEFFSQNELSVPPSFHSRVINCASMEVLQAYLLWRQTECHISNQYNTCLWKLVFSGKSEKEAKEILKGTQKQEQNELLFQQFGINYKDLPQIFRQGSCAIKIKVDDIVKYREDGTPVKRPRKKAVIVHSENVATKRFWNNYTCLTEELGSLAEGINKIKPEYLRSFQFESRLMLSTWIVVRVDGCHFHRFCDDNGFQKPNDEQALKLMNSCAVSLLEMFKDIIFAYGVSDEYSFVLKKDSLLYQRWSSEIVSAVVSLFSSMYVMKWKEFFHKKEFKEPPYFDGRSVCYPSSEILRDYLAWRQVDCHINNQYNTCFWLLVKSGKTRTEAQSSLKGTQTQEKNELLAKFGIDYNALPIIFRMGSSVFQDRDELTGNDRVVVEHCNIIETSFWKEHPRILNEEEPLLTILRPLSNKMLRLS